MSDIRKRGLGIVVVLTVILSVLLSGSVFAREQPGIAEEYSEAFSYLSSLPPGWVTLLAREFGIDRSELIPLYKAGMDYKEIKDYLLELYPVPEINLSNQDYLDLSYEADIDKMDAVKCYELAYKWRKDPVWLASLFKRTGSWEEVEEAFEKRQEFKDSLNRSNELSQMSTMSVSSVQADLSLQAARSYNVNSQIVNTMMNAGATSKDVSDILFFMDITATANDRRAAEVYGSSPNSMMQSTSASLEIGLNGPLQEGWLDELPEEIEYLRNDWPKRHFPDELLPLEVPESKQAKTRSMSVEDPIQFFQMPSFSIQSDTDVYATTRSIQAASTDTADLVDLDELYNVDKSSPFNAYFEGTSEYVNPNTGTLMISQQDFVLPGKYGMDFSFTRVFDGNVNMLERPSVSVTQSGGWVQAGSTSDTETIEERYMDGARKVNVIEWSFTYGAQSLVNGNVYGTYCLKETEYFYYPGQSTPATTYVIRDGCYQDARPPKPTDISGIQTNVNVYAVPSTRKSDLFSLGEGWTIAGIPVAEVVNANEMYVYLNGEGTYKVGTDGYLEGRGAKDLRFSTNAGYSYDGVTSSYALSNVNGTVWYFNNTGKPIACKGKHNQYIRFKYTSAGKMDRITDTVGRVIKFTYNGSNVLVDVYESSSSSVSLQSWRYELQPTGVTGKSNLVKVHQPTGQTVTFGYSPYSTNYSVYYNGLAYNTNLACFNLTSVKHTTEATTNYTYTVNKVTSRQDSVSTFIATSSGVTSQTKVQNKAAFTYNNSVTTKTSTRDNGEAGVAPVTEKWEYDSYNRLIKHTLVGQNGGINRQDTETVETTFGYLKDSSKMPLSVKVKRYLSGSSAVVETVEKSIYDEYGNVIAFVDSNGKRTEYTYDHTYNMVTEMMEYSDYTDSLKKGRQTSYTLDSTKKKVASEKVTMVQKNPSGTITYICPTGTISGNAFVWTPEGPITNASITLYWNAGGWGDKSQYIVKYRKAGESAWTNYFVSPTVSGGMSTTSGTYTVNIVLQGLDYYDICVERISGGLRIESGSVATGTSFSNVALGSSISSGYEYDTNNPGNITAVNTYPVGATTGTPETRTTYVYDTLWKAYPVESTTQVTKADGSISTVKSTVTYDKLGRPVSVRDEEVGVTSSETQYQYDGLGRVIKVINPPHSNNTTGSEQNVTYMDSLRQVQITDELGNVTRQTYDGLGRTSYTEWKDASNVWHIAGHSRYDSLGRLVSSFDANFNETKYEYDAFGRQVKAIAPDNSQVQNWYVGVNLPISSNPTLSLTPPTGFATPQLSGWNKVQDADGNVGYQGYDILGRLVWTAVNPKTSPEAGVPSWDMTWYEYDKFDRVIKKAVNRTATTWDITTYGYEYNNKPTVFTSPLTVDLPGDTEPVTVYEYNSRGLKVKEYPVTNPSQAMQIEYDELGRVKRVNYPSQQEYINTGNTFMPTTSNVTRRDEFYYGIYGITRADSYANNMLENRYQASYNQRGWKTTESWNLDNTDYTFSYGYDAAGNRTSMTYPDNTTNTYIYDELSRMIRIPGYFERANGQSGFSYDPVGNMTDMWSINGIHTQFIYNTRNMATGIISTPLSLAYTYSGNGNIVKITDTTGATPVELNYTYDAKGQLKTAQVNKPTGIETVSYSYDGTSNRISETWKNKQNQILSQYTYTYQPGDYLVSKTDPSSVVNYTWDIYGQLSSKSSGENYIFTGKRNLNTVTESNTVKEIYTYDALGRRLKVQNSDTITLNFPLGNDTSYEVKKEGTDTTVTKYISANGKYLAKTIKVNNNPEQKYFHHIDLVGSIRAITDATGAVTASYEYEPFGVTIKTTGTDKDNLGFAGKRLDAGSGLSYFGARYYDSEMGRFISRDPAQDGRNWFVYCANNPLGYRDPNGLMVKMKYGYTLESTLEDGFTYSTSRDDVKELDTYKILLKKTLSLLFQDETFMKLWKDIWNDPTVYYITVTKTLGEQYSYDDKTRTIFIYPLGFDGNRNLDPSTKMKLDGLLNHEFGHLYEHYLYTKTGKSVSYESYLKFEQTGNSMYQEICERIIIGKYETNYNIKTGQPLRRWYLNDFNGNPAKLLTGDTTEYFVNWIDLESRGIN